ncbi:hypothetical protein ABIB25_002837 [Nakamurella sp. UYEF19]|uniref:hypothetical protein n=1 Tax=Nakamurella sp. UYEF19 TaxID=1756392 RepID=UPI003394BBCA
MLCLRILRDHRILCALLAATSAFSNMLYVQAGHSQLYSVHWLPLILLLVIRAAEGRRAPRLQALLAGLLTGLLFLSTYYVAWFAVLCSVIALILFGWLGGTLRAGLAAWRTTLARSLSRLTWGAVGLLLGPVPFAVLYLPTLGSAGRSLGGVLQNAPEPIDILNTGQRNFVWGPLTRTVFDGSPRLSNGELGFGLTPIALALLVTATIRFCLRTRAARSRWNRAALTTSLVACTAILLPMKIFSVVSAWILVWFLVPGSYAIRANDRIGVIAGLALPLVVAFLLADVLRKTVRHPSWRPRVIAAATAVLMLLALEQANVGRNAGIDRPAELAALAAVPVQPPGCRTFFLTVHRLPAQPAYESSIDAMLISQHLGLPTINGFSGQFPAGYGSVADPSAPDYAAGVARWIDDNGLVSGVCRYDETAHTWAKVAGR